MNFYKIAESLKALSLILFEKIVNKNIKSKISGDQKKRPIKNDV